MLDPVFARRSNLFMRTCNEVPPHYDGIGEWFATKQEHARPGRSADVQLLTVRAEIMQRVRFQVLVVQEHVATQDKKRVLEITADRNHRGLACSKRNFGADYRAEHLGGRSLTE